MNAGHGLDCEGAGQHGLANIIYLVNVIGSSVDFMALYMTNVVIFHPMTTAALS